MQVLTVLNSNVNCPETKSTGQSLFPIQKSLYHEMFNCCLIVSDLYEGSTSDVDILEQCGILQHVNMKDSSLVDKGFTMLNLLLPKEATIFIPPFLGKHEKFTKEEVMLTKQIAKARIQVERFNERLQKFRLLDTIIPLSLVPLASQLVYVGCILVNFQEFLWK